MLHLHKATHIIGASKILKWEKKLAANSKKRIKRALWIALYTAEILLYIFYSSLSYLEHNYAPKNFRHPASPISSREAISAEIRSVIAEQNSHRPSAFFSAAPPAPTPPYFGLQRNWWQCPVENFLKVFANRRFFRQFFEILGSFFEILRILRAMNS